MTPIKKIKNMNIAILVFSILAILVVVYFLMKKKPIVTTTTTTIAQAPITLDVRFENVLTSYGQSYDYKKYLDVFYNNN